MNRWLGVAALSAACVSSCNTERKPSPQPPALASTSPAKPAPTTEPFVLTREEGDALLVLARRSFEAKVRENRTIAVPPEALSTFPRLGARRGAFVTLRKKGDLRGCIGTLEAHRPLAEDVVMNAVSAAVEDPRFSPVTPDEIKDIEVSISVLDAPRPLERLAPDALLERLGKTHPGIILSLHGRRSTFLPEVWDELPDATGFLTHLCNKQGAPGNCWRDPAIGVEIYGSQHLAETKP
jgi:AmmeMemoRadiSam system protein A